MNFPDQIKERKEILEAAGKVLADETYSLVAALETRINELESDLENEQDLTKKLKGLLDGGLVGELVVNLENVTTQLKMYHETRTGFAEDANIITHAEVAITKAKESMP